MKITYKALVSICSFVVGERLLSVAKSIVHIIVCEDSDMFI